MSSLVTIVYNMALSNGVHRMETVSKISAIMITLPVFVVTVAYRVISLVTVTWLITRLDVGEEANNLLGFQKRTEFVGFLSGMFSLVALVGVVGVLCRTCYRNRKIGDNLNYTDIYMRFLSWYFLSFIIGPIFLVGYGGSEKQLTLYKKKFRYDAILNLIIRSIILITIGIMYENNYLEINTNMCPSGVFKENFSLICYILVPVGIVPCALIEIAFKMISLVERCKVMSALAYC